MSRVNRPVIRYVNYTYTREIILAYLRHLACNELCKFGNHNQLINSLNGPQVSISQGGLINVSL